MHDSDQLPTPSGLPADPLTNNNGLSSPMWHANGHDLEELSQYAGPLLANDTDEDIDPEELSLWGQEVLCSGEAAGVYTASGVDKHDLFAVFPKLGEFEQDCFSFDEIFTAHEKHGYKTRANRLKFRLLETTYGLLINRILIDGERVHKVSRGIIYYPFEVPYANGLLTALSNYFAIICTDHRILFVNIDFRSKSTTRYVYQVLYEEVTDVSRSIFLTSLKIKTRNQRNWNFTTVGRTSAKEIKDFINSSGKEGPSGLFNGVTRWQLCPLCDKFLAVGLVSCPHCVAVFKRADEAMTRSLILPGLGSLYLSYIPLGIIEMTGYLAVWFTAIVLLILKAPGGAATAILLVLSYHVLTGFLARRNALKGYLLEPAQFPAVVTSEGQK